MDDLKNIRVAIRRGKAEEGASTAPGITWWRVYYKQAEFFALYDSPSNVIRTVITPEMYRAWEG